ncbi:MAG: hypothetical protein PHE25_04310 [Candidatus Gracilibacteria bacterium]|nr:hypothetical protein [Candidatus Gracilibacteria bacterium]
MSISSFSGIILFLLIGKRIDIPFIDISNTWLCKLNSDLIIIKYLLFLIIILLFSYFSIYLAKKFLFDGNGETITVKEIKPIEGSFLPVYIGLFVIALSFNEKNLTFETIFLMIILFLFWLKLDSVSYFNPFLLFFGYRFYEIKSDNTTTFTLITKRKDLKNIDSINNLIGINNFTFLEK